MEFTEEYYHSLCKRRIEEKFQLGNGDSNIRQREFEYLMDLIEEKSGIRLSISTLKRFWKEQGIQNPHPSTLDGLVSVLGYKDWLEFKVENMADKVPGKVPDKKGVLRKPLFIASVSGVMILAVAFLMTSFGEHDKSNFPDPEDVLFTANKTVTKGVPSTVIFNYDVSGIEADSFFIQQDWNPNHRDQIKQDGQYFSSIYYMPGFHKTKLIANENILKIIPVHIQSDGWMSAAMYNYDERPVYIQKDDKEDGLLSADPDDILNSSMDIERFSMLSYINIREYGGLSGHNFEYETRLRYKKFLNDPCPVVMTTIHTEVHIFYVPLTLRGCESNIELKLGEVYKSGRENDLSMFGTDVYDWQLLRLKVVDKKAEVYLNGSKVYEQIFEEDFGRIVGLDYRFSGLGEIDYVFLKEPDGKLIYEDNFEELEQ